MAKRLLLISGNFSPEAIGTGKYNGEMINWLAAKGYDCTVITSYPYYPDWKVKEPYARKRYRYSKEVSANGKITVYRCPQYVPATPSGKGRVLLDLTFFITAFFKLIQLLPAKKYDIVVTVVPAFHLGLLAVLYKKLRGAKFLYHIQDMQIEAARDLRMIRSPRLIKILFQLEKYIMRNATVVSSISDGMIRRIKEKAKREILSFPNWVDIKVLRPLPDRNRLKKEYGFEEDDKIVLYSGAIGEKQGLESILTSAGELPHLKFLICGAGPYKEKLQHTAARMALTNVHFFPLQPYEQFNRFMNIADVHLIIQKSNASDLVMPSKLTTIMSVGGVALITADEGSALHALVSRHNMGVLVRAEDQAELTAGISRAASLNATIITNNARSYAETYLAIDNVMAGFENAVINQH